MKAKKKFGQNFLIDNTVLDSISNAVFAFSEDLIIEIGPGRAALTKKLIEKNCDLIAYEIDNDMKTILSKLENDKFKVIYGDFLNSDIKSDIKDINYKNLHIVGNLPYYITTPILEKIINANLDLSSITIMVQKEVADRFLAKPKSKDYGYFTLFLSYYFNSERIIDVPAESFDPAPKVKSAVVKFTPKENINLDKNKYFDFLKDCFKEKRKTLRNNLKNYNLDKMYKVLNKYNLSESSRAEELSEEVFIDLFLNLVH